MMFDSVALRSLGTQLVSAAAYSPLANANTIRDLTSRFVYSREACDVSCATQHLHEHLLPARLQCGRTHQSS